MVDRGFNCGVMVSVLAKSVVDRGFICGVMVSVLAKSVLDRGFDPRSCHTEDYGIGICSFCIKHLVLRVRIKTGWFACV